MAYTTEGVMAQISVAFGQGTGAMRVHHEAALALREMYFPLVTPDVITRWPKEAVQALERVRAIGRLAASKAAARGATSISAADVTSSANTVHAVSDTDFCPPGPVPGTPPPSG